VGRASGKFGLLMLINFGFGGFFGSHVMFCGQLAKRMCEPIQLC